MHLLYVYFGYLQKVFWFALLTSRFLTKGMSAIVEIKISRPICMELYQNYRELGRFMLRYGGTTIAAGIITEVFLGFSV